MVVIGPLYHGTIPDDRVKHGRLQDGRGGGPLQPGAGDDQGGEEERERHSGNNVTNIYNVHKMNCQV